MTDPFAPIGAGENGRRAPPREAVMPVPADAPPAPGRHPKLGVPTSRWTYRDAAGAVLGYVCRFDGPEGKEFRPLVLFRAGAGTRWRWESWPPLRPLYGLDRLAARPGADVVVTEGEKACDAAAILLPDQVVVASPNGSLAAGKAEWTPLRGRRVTIWPDADAAGLTFAQRVTELARDAGATAVAAIAPPADAAVGWDAADALAEGWTSARALELVRSAGLAEAPVAPAAGRRRSPQRDTLMDLTAGCELWQGLDGEGFATIPVNGHFESWSIRSRWFKRWLASRAYDEKGLVPGAQAVEDTLRVLEARATAHGPERKPWLRTGYQDDRIYVDLGDRAWRAVEVASTGWRLIERHGLPFVRSQAMRPLPDPEGGSAIEELRRFVNVAGEEDFVLVVAWLLAALRDRGPYPILVVNGEQGSGKSTFARLIRTLVDPNTAPIRGTPKDDRDLIIAAENARVLAYDNLSRVEAWLADGLCRLASGSGFSTRMLHTDKDEVVFEAARPIILNGIPLLTDRADLADRAVTIRLSTIAEAERRPEDEFWEDWAAVAPRVFGALLDAVSTALGRVKDVRLPGSPRLADFAKWAVAAEPGLGWAPGTFMAAYGENRRDVADSAFEASPIAVAIHKLVQEPAYVDDGWTGTATELLGQLNGLVSEGIRKSRAWPITAQGLGNTIDRVAPLLRGKGLHVERKHSGVRTITIVPLKP